jgi:hypothetical protein
MPQTAESLVVPLGTVKQFGETGPQYEVLAPAPPENGRQMMRIVLVRTGEELNYPTEAILEDMDAV